MPLPGSTIPSPPLWAEGRLSLWVEGPRFPARAISIDRPYALVGRVPGCDVRIPDPALSAFHVYLHVDARGVFAVDLATRTGTRFHRTPDLESHSSSSVDSWSDYRDKRTAWLAIGESFEIAEHRIEIVKTRVEPESGLALISNPATRRGPLPSLLGTTPPDAPLAAVTLVPQHAPTPPQSLTSELVFVGSSASCGVQIDDRSLPRIQAVLVRSHSGAYVVNFTGRDMWVNVSPVPHACELNNGDALRIGSAHFAVRMAIAPRRPPAPESELALQTQGQATELLTHPTLPAGLALPDSFSGEGHEQILAWLMGALHAGQGEVVRRQTHFQNAMVDLIRQMQENQVELIRAQIDRMEQIDDELARLKAELRDHANRIKASPRPSPATLSPPSAAARPRPNPIVPQTPKSSPHLKPAPTPDAAPPTGSPVETDPVESTAWLLARIHTLEHENRIGWRDLLSKARVKGGKPNEGKT